MTKTEYLKQLEDELRYKISEQEMYDIMRDYAEYFEEGKKLGKTDKQIIEALGIPYVVAKQILGETPDDVNAAIKKGAVNIKSSFDSLRESTKSKYNEQKEKHAKKKFQKENVSYTRPAKVKVRGERNLFVSFCLGILKISLWIFLFIPLIICVGASGMGLIIGSIVGIGFLSAFSLTVSTYTIFTASLVLLSLLFSGLTVIFGFIWFIEYLLGTSSLKEQCSFKGSPDMDYGDYNFQQQSPDKNCYNNFSESPEEKPIDYQNNKSPVEDDDITEQALGENAIEEGK